MSSAVRITPSTVTPAGALPPVCIPCKAAIFGCLAINACNCAKSFLPNSRAHCSVASHNWPSCNAAVTKSLTVRSVFCACSWVICVCSCAITCLSPASPAAVAPPADTCACKVATVPLCVSTSADNAATFSLAAVKSACSFATAVTASSGLASSAKPSVFNNCLSIVPSSSLTTSWLKNWLNIAGLSSVNPVKPGMLVSAAISKANTSPVSSSYANTGDKYKKCLSAISARAVSVQSTRT